MADSLVRRCAVATQGSAKLRILATLMVVGIAGCGSELQFNIYPPDARIAASGSCYSPCTLRLTSVPAQLRYRIEKEPGYRSTEGILHAKVAPGRVIGAIFTLGILAATKGVYYFPPTEAQLEPSVDPSADLRAIRKRGTGRIEGQAFTETRGGEVRHAAGDTVTMRVDTPYVRDALRYLAFRQPPEEGRVTSQPNLQFLEGYQRQMMADAEGRFAFDDVPAGRYLVSAMITWEVPGQEGMETQRVPVVGFAEVRDQETTKTLATDWVKQQIGVGRLGEGAVPRLSPDEESMGQRRMPNEEPGR